MNIYAHLHEHRAPIFKILDVAVAVAAVATIPVTVLQLRGDQNAWILAVDWLIWSTFIAEYLVMLALPEDEGGFRGANQWDRRNFRDWRNWVSLVIIVLSFPPLDPLLRVVRLVRVARLARLGKIATVSTRGVGHTLGRRGVYYVLGFVVLAIVIGGVAITEVEPKVSGSEDIVDGLWWAMSTAVGTGVGDPGPQTPAGRMIAMTLVLCGVAFITTLAGSIAAYFLGEGEDDAKLQDIARRLDLIQAQLAAGQSPSNRGEEAPP
jgi:voltage-gated potassium channel